MSKKSKYGIGKLFIATLLLVLSIDSYGQQMSYGFFGGITASQVDGDAYTGFNKLGVTAGAFINRYIEYDIYWQAEVKYVTRGVYKGPGDNDPTLYRGGYHYVELPLSVHYLHDDKIQLEMGTSPEVLVKTYFSDQDGIIDPASYPENRRFGLSVFGGLCYWISGTTGLGIRYTYSAIPFRDPAEWNHPGYRGYFHNVICMTAAYRIKHD
ncbi:MAG: outer membrane beta-barrel protein [Bacteroidota bacterium]